MSKVDWSLAPDDAQIYSPAFNGIHACWYKSVDGEVYLWCESEPRWSLREAMIGELIERPSEQSKPWSGPEDGLPPVGFRCEAGIPHTSGPDHEISIIWIEGSVIAYYEINGSTYAWFAEDDGFYPPAVLDFRPIKAPDQISAEQRETSIRELMDIAQVDCRVTAARLVDAGFKREACKSDCSTNNRGVPELLGPCDCR